MFYPRAAGQPADRGTLTLLPDGATLNVTDVHEHDGIPLAQRGRSAGKRCSRHRRFRLHRLGMAVDKMQQHTGEHILSGILHQMFGAENVGFTIGSEGQRMDTSVPISAEGLQAAEPPPTASWQDVPVLVSYPTRGACRPCLPLQKGDRRAGAHRDHSRCGMSAPAAAPHTCTTGQVGQIKILASENYKGGALSVVCGQRAHCLLHSLCASGRQRSGRCLGQGRPDRCGGIASTMSILRSSFHTLRMFSAVRCTAQLATPVRMPSGTVPTLTPDVACTGWRCPDRSHHRSLRRPDPHRKGTGYCIAQADGDVRALIKALNAP